MDSTPTKSSIGMDENTAAGLSVLLAVLGIGIVTLIFFIIEKDSKFNKFHSLQAILLMACMVILYILGTILMIVLIGFLFYILAIVPWVFMIIQCIKAFQGEVYKAPFVGNLAEKWAGGSR